MSKSNMSNSNDQFSTIIAINVLLVVEFAPKWLTDLNPLDPERQRALDSKKREIQIDHR